MWPKLITGKCRRYFVILFTSIKDSSANENNAQMLSQFYPNYVCFWRFDCGLCDSSYIAEIRNQWIGSWSLFCPHFKDYFQIYATYCHREKFLTNSQNCVAWQTVLIMKNLQVLEMYSLQVYTMVTECCWNKASGALSHFIFFCMLHFK